MTFERNVVVGSRKIAPRVHTQRDRRLVSAIHQTLPFVRLFCGEDHRLKTIRCKTNLQSFSPNEKLEVSTGLVFENS